MYTRVARRLSGTSRRNRKRVAAAACLADSGNVTLWRLCRAAIPPVSLNQIWPLTARGGGGGPRGRPRVGAVLVCSPPQRGPPFAPPPRARPPRGLFGR